MVGLPGSTGFILVLCGDIEDPIVPRQRDLILVETWEFDAQDEFVVLLV